MADQLLGKQPWGLTAEPLLPLENTHRKKPQIMALNHNNFYCLPSTERWSALFLFLSFKIAARNPLCWKVIWKSLERLQIQCTFQDGKVLCKTPMGKVGGKVLKIIKPWKLLKHLCLYQLGALKAQNQRSCAGQKWRQNPTLPQIFAQRDGQSCPDTGFVLKAAEHKPHFL